MTKEELIELKKQLSTLTEEEQKERDLYLRGLANGEIQGPPVGYPSIDKPWLQWYDSEDIMLKREKTNVYDYFKNVAPNDCCLINYYGKKFYKQDIINEVEKYISKFSTMGICEGTTVSFIMLNVPEIIFAWLALSKMGATANFIKFDETPERIKLMNDIGKSEYMFITELPFIMKSVAKSIELGSQLKQVITVPITSAMPKIAQMQMIVDNVLAYSKNNSTTLIKSLINNVNDLHKGSVETKEILSSNPFFVEFKDWNRNTLNSSSTVVDNGSENISIIVYTGGTTGNPKGVELTNDNITAMAHDFNYSRFGFTPGKTSMNILPPGPAYYLNATYGLMCCGVTVQMISNFKIDEYPELIKKYRPNIFLSGPILLKAIADKDVMKDCSFITDPISGGDKLHLAEEDKINEYLKLHGSDAIVHQGYGESESTAAATYAKKNASITGTIGIPMLDINVSIFDYRSHDEPEIVDNAEKRYNEIGEICISGPTIMRGYRDNSMETKKVLRLHEDGKIWLHTDDLGYMDENGRLFHCGRAKRMLTRSGNKVWLGALEETIKQHPNVFDCCCVKKNDDDEREVPIAHIVLKDDTIENTFEEIDEMIILAQPESYVPKYYVQRDDIPITSINNKVDFKKMEEEDIFDCSVYEKSGKVIRKKTKKLKKSY